MKPPSYMPYVDSIRFSFFRKSMEIISLLVGIAGLWISAAGYFPESRNIKYTFFDGFKLGAKSDLISHKIEEKIVFEGNNVEGILEGYSLLIWNDGKHAINGSSVRDPIRVKSMNVRLLDSSIVYVNSPGNGKFNCSDAGGAIQVDFEYIEPQSGFACRIIFEKLDGPGKFEVEGYISGVEIEKYNLDYKVLLPFILPFSIALVVMFVVNILLGRLQKNLFARLERVEVWCAKSATDRSKTFLYFREKAVAFSTKMVVPFVANFSILLVLIMTPAINQIIDGEYRIVEEVEFYNIFSTYINELAYNEY